MYETHFGFHRQPFHSADASRAFFITESIRTILPQLLHALRSDLGIAILTGVPGSGRTSLLRHIQQQLSNEGRVIVCSGASLGTPNELTGVLLQASRMKAGSKHAAESVAADPVPLATRSSVMEHMRRTAELWGPILLLIDDAQLAPVAVLNELRACTEEEWNGRNLVRCLVSAPISFEEQLARPECAEFGRRIRCHVFLQPMKAAESVHFLQEQIELVGGRISQVLTAAAVELIARAADGIPRCLSLLADETLVVAAECGEKTATEQSVRTALNRLQHLQYNWNASPHADNSESPLSHDADTAEVQIGHDASPKIMIAEVASPTITATVNRATPVHATLSPGVIEFGGPSRTVAEFRPATQFPARAVTVASSNSVEPGIGVMDREHDSVASLVSTETAISGARFHLAEHVRNVLHVRNTTVISAPVLDEPTQPSVFEFGIPQAVADFVRSEPVAITYEASAPFEVGRRFFAESSADSISIEDVDDSDIVNLLNPGGELDREPWSVNTFSASTSSGNFDDSCMSNLMPVFDRYTWIALGREVPPGVGAIDSQPMALQLMLADYGMLATNRLAAACLQTASVRQMGSIDQISITQTEDAILIDEILHRLPSREEGPFELFRTVLVNDEASPEFSGLKIWQDGRLILAQFGDSDSRDSAGAVVQPSGTFEDAVDETALQQLEPLIQIGQDGFFTLPVRVERDGWDLQSAGISCDHDVFSIVESVTDLRADVRQFQQSGRMTGNDPDGTAGVCTHEEKRTHDADTLISRAKRRLDDRTEVTDSAVVALQMVSDSRTKRTASNGVDSEEFTGAGSNSETTPQFSRLFTRLWENRRRAEGQAEPDRRG